MQKQFIAGDKNNYNFALFCFFAYRWDEKRVCTVLRDRGNLKEKEKKETKKNTVAQMKTSTVMESYQRTNHKRAQLY